MSYQYSSYNRETDDFLTDEDNFYSAEVSVSADTEDASETESQSNRIDEPVEIKEQMYQDKLANLKKQLEELKTMSHPEYIRRIKKLEYQYQERLRLNEIYRDYLMECVEKDYILEKNAAVKEYEEKKMDLKENLLTDFEDKRKLIESERHSMELMGDSINSKPKITRTLRPRANEPIPVSSDQKRRKQATGQLILLLEDKDIDSDLKLISRGKSIMSSSNSNSIRHSIPSSNQSYNNMNSGNSSQSSMMMMSQSGSMNMMSPAENGQQQQLVETRIEDGKLWFERRWFHRGQAVTVEGKDIPRFSSNISAIGNEVIWVKRTNDGNKVRIYLRQLQTGKVSIKRRAN